MATEQYNSNASGTRLAQKVGATSFRILRDEQNPTPTPGGALSLPTRKNNRTKNQ
jgi:hypothetical protein